jgi:hypothetical protein
MTIEDALLAVIRALDDVGTPHMVVGSFSTNFYGLRRPTEDADLVLDLGPQTIPQLATRLGAALRIIPQMCHSRRLPERRGTRSKWSGRNSKSNCST